MATYEVENSALEVPREWKQINPNDLHGVVMVLGASDVGKSTLAGYLANMLAAQGQPVAYLDGDPGQGILGPPATMTLAVGTEPSFSPFRDGKVRRWFVASVTPRGHMLPIVVGAQRLAQAAFQAGAHVLIYDTTGLIDPNQGGGALKIAKIDLLKPSAIIAIQEARELEHILMPLRRLSGIKLIELPPAPVVRSRSREERQRNRARRFKAYFRNAGEMEIFWPQLAVIPKPHFSPNRLVAFESSLGFAQSLGIVVGEQRQDKQVKFLTPLNSLESTEIIRVGDLKVDPVTFRDERA
jgi:polynucleotide 5'-kinase involved in rRNA processing